MNAALAAAWDALRLPADALGHVRFTGHDALPSCYPVTDLAAGSIAAAALAVSQLVASTGVAPPSVSVDRRRASLWFGWSLQPSGWPMPDARDPVTGDYRTADGWIRLHGNAPRHRAAELRVLGGPDGPEAVAAAVARWSADELESAIVEAGGCAATMRSTDAWERHPQGRSVASEPLVDVRGKPCEVSAHWRPEPARPMAGIKVLDLTRVLAGPVATRFLAGYGADVLRVDPLTWDEPGVVPEVTLGKRCTRLDLEDRDDRATFERLLGEADVLVHGYRPDALAALGYDVERRRAIRPDLVEVTLDAYGWTGPWRARRGFDSLVQMSCGIAAAGMDWRGADRPVPLPVQALDHATGYLIAAAVVAGVLRRTAAGEASVARLSLARTARLLVDLPRSFDEPPPWSGTTDADLAAGIERTAWGPARRVAPPADVAGAPMAWARGATRLGSDAARWRGDRDDPAIA